MTEYTADSLKQRFEKCTYVPSRRNSEPGQRDNHGDMRQSMGMNDITRPELDAKLELIEARMDARIARIESSVEGFKDEAGKLRTELSHAKYWAIGTAVAVLAVFASFLQWGLQSQRDENARFNSYLREDVKAAAAQNQQLLNDAKALLEQIRAQQAPSSAAPPTGK